MSNYVYTAEEAAYYGKVLFNLIGSGELKIKVYKEYPFTTEGVREAQADLTARGGKTVGKLLLKIV